MAQRPSALDPKNPSAVKSLAAKFEPPPSVSEPLAPKRLPPKASTDVRNLLTKKGQTASESLGLGLGATSSVETRVGSVESSPIGARMQAMSSKPSTLSGIEARNKASGTADLSDVPTAELAKLSSVVVDGDRPFPYGVVKVRTAPWPEGWKPDGYADDGGPKKGFTLVVETEHATDKSPTMTDQLKLVVKGKAKLPGSSEEVSVAVPLDLPKVTVDAGKYHSRVVLNIPFAKITELTGGKVNGATDLAVRVDWQNGHYCGDFDRGGVFRIPFPERVASAKPPRVDFEKITTNIKGATPKEVSDAHSIVKVGGETISTMETEAEYSLGTSLAPDYTAQRQRLEGAVAKMEELAGDPEKVKALLGEGWAVTKVKKYDDPVTATSSRFPGSAIKKQLPLTDTYYDLEGCPILKSGASLRNRGNALKTDLLCAKGTAVDVDGAMVRFAAQIDTNPGSRTKYKGIEALVRDEEHGGPVREAILSQTGKLPDPSSKNVLRPRLQIDSERYRYKIENTTSHVAIEWSADFASAQKLNGMGGKFGDPIQLLSCEFGLDHLAASMATTDGPSGPKPEAPAKKKPLARVGSSPALGKPERAPPKRSGSSPSLTTPAPKAPAFDWSKAELVNFRFHDAQDLLHDDVIHGSKGRTEDFLAARGKLIGHLFASEDGLTPSGYKASEAAQGLGLIDGSWHAKVHKSPGDLATALGRTLED